MKHVQGIQAELTEYEDKIDQMKSGIEKMQNENEELKVGTYGIHISYETQYCIIAT